MEERGTRIVVQLDGSAIVVRTPLARSAKFRTLDDAVRWHEGQMAGVMPMLIAGGVCAVAKAVLPEDVFLPIVFLALIGGGVASVIVTNRARRGLPEPTWLSWEESVRADDRAHPITQVFRDLGVSLACGALLALVGFLIADDPHHIEREGMLVMVMAGVFVLALVVGVAIGIVSAVQRLRFHATRRAQE